MRIYIYIIIVIISNADSVVIAALSVCLNELFLE